MRSLEASCVPDSSKCQHTCLANGRCVTDPPHTYLSRHFTALSFFLNSKSLILAQKFQIQRLHRSRRVQSPLVARFAKTIVTVDVIPNNTIHFRIPIFPKPLTANVSLLSFSSSRQSNGWDPNDMFKFNEEKYGVLSTYDSSLSTYTYVMRASACL